MGTFGLATFSLAGIVAVSACTTAPQIKDAEQIAPDTNVVFGSVEVWSGDKQQKWGPTWTGHNHFYLFILPDGTIEAITYHLDKDGQFYWALPPGDYLLLGYEWQKNQQRMSSDIGATFSVPEEGVDHYIGALVFRGNDYVLQTFLLDQYDKAKALYDAKFPGRKGTSEKRFMELLPPLGEFESVAGQCHKSWSIECDKRYSGVTPLSPEVTTSGFPKTSNLSPEFRWQGSSRPDVSYDLVIFEAATFSIDRITSDHMKGRLVEYIEDIKGTNWRLDTSLKPETKYYWSVRLRDGGRVSRWSTQSHFGFIIVAMWSGSGQWFQFETP